MKVLIVSEGKNEMGSVPREGMPEQKGALTVLVERLLEQEIQFDWLRVSDPRVMAYYLPGKVPESTQYFKRAMAWVAYASDKGFGALVFVVDEDGFRERWAGIKEAQAETSFGLPRAMGLAIRMFDAWMLADERALSKVLGIKVNPQSDPEKNLDPKRDCDELGIKGKYPQVANLIDLKRLEELCPKGFKPFADRVRQLKSGPRASSDAAQSN